MSDDNIKAVCVCVCVCLTVFAHVLFVCVCVFATDYAHLPSGLKAHYNSLKRLPEKLYFFLLWAKSSFHDWSMLTESVKIQSGKFLKQFRQIKSGVSWSRDKH